PKELPMRSQPIFTSPSSSRFRPGFRTAVLVLSAGLVFLCLPVAPPTSVAKPPDTGRQKGKPFGIDKRIPWTASRVNGSPDPPHPYRIERVFPRLRFTNPLLLAWAPGLDRFFVGEHAGKIYSFRNDPKRDKADLF